LCWCCWWPSRSGRWCCDERPGRAAT
jgi:hypothetical protein